MLYCPGKGQELLSALGVNLECHASSIFLVLKSFSQRSFFKFHKMFYPGCGPSIFSQFRLFTIDGLRSKVPKRKFDWYKMSKHVRIALKVDISGIKLHVKLFQ